MAREKLTKQERSWILYDVANSAQVLLASTLIPIYFRSLAEGSVVVAWGYAETVASLIVALLMPLLGSFADLQGNKKKFLIGCVGTGVLASVCLGFPTHGAAFLAVYIVSSVCLNSSMVFYDALLVDATTPEKYDKISSYGFAWGYIGSVVPFLVCLGLVLGWEQIGLSSMQVGMRIAFVVTGAWWAVFTIPIVHNVHQTHFKERTAHVLYDSITGLVATCKRIVADRTLALFMLAFFFYIDGVHTIIKMATSYGTDLGIDATQLLLALLVTQFVAFPSAIVYGRITPQVGTKRMLLISVAAYSAITLFAAFFLRSATEFWILAVCVGLFQGGIQALSRSAFGRLIPKEHANEYFGFFDVFGKYASIMGTALVSISAQITGSSSLGVLSVLVLFVVGFILLLKVPSDLG